MAEPTGMPRYPGSGGAASVPPGPLAEEPTDSIVLPRTRFQAWFRNSSWIFLGVFCFIFFTVSKLPRDRISDVIQGNISSFLASRGITFSAKKADLSLLFGVVYDLKGVTLNFPAPQPPAQIDEIEISPSILPLLIGEIGAKVRVRNGDGAMNLAGSFRGHRISTTFSARRFNIGNIALLKLLTNVAGSATLTGQGSLSTDLDAMTETNADIRLNLSKIIVDGQSIQGFAIPRLSMSEGKIDFSIDHGRGMLHSLRLGAPGSTSDDIRADITGDILFGKSLNTSTCNLKANFSFSPTLLNSFSLLSALLAAGRQPDGSFSYKLVGPLLSPNPMPAGGH